jgi:hypothetical protein
MRPVRVGVDGGISKDMTMEGELHKNQKHLVVPASVVVGIHVKYYSDEGADVLDVNGLGVQVYYGGGLMSQLGILERLARATVARKQPKVVEVAGKGGGAIRGLAGSLVLASGAGECVTGVSGG